MKWIIALLLASVLMLGCTGGAPQAQGTPAASNGTGPAAQQNQTQQAQGQQQAAAQACTPEYSFSELPDGTLAKTAHLTGTAACAAGSRLAVKLDGTVVAMETVAAGESAAFDIAFVPGKEGAVKLTVESDGTGVLSKDWNVAPLGSSDTKGMENDAISFKEWRGMAFTTEGQLQVSKVKLFLKRLQSTTQPGTTLALDIRADSGGNPGGIIATVERPLNVTTLSDNWVAFEFAQPQSLAPGKYWAVLRVEQNEDVSLVSDVVNLHYVTVDKKSPGNDYTRQMMLSVDQKTGAASETSWAPLAYDRVYSMTIHGTG
jgi:hypothetical protein